MNWRFDTDLGGTFAMDAPLTERLEAVNASTEDSEELVAADQPEQHTGAMIAAVISLDDAERFTVDADGAESASELHITLAYFGDAVTEFSDEQRERFFRLGEELASEQDALLEVGVAGNGQLGSEGAVVLFLNSDPLDELHDEVLERTEEDFSDWTQFRPWIPHMTIGYGISLDLGTPLIGENFMVDRIRVAVGNDVADYTITPVTVQASDTMMDNRVEGQGDMGATTATERPIVTQDGQCPPGFHRPPDSDECVADEDTMADTVNFEGVAVVEGEWTGDSRQFAEGSLTWPDPAEVILPFEWQKETTHGGINDVVVSVGRITSLSRVGNEIKVAGYLDLGSEDGKEYVRRVKNGTAGGVSIVADDPEQAEMEIICDSEVTEGDETFCMKLKGVIFHSGRIRSLTGVNVPAFTGAWIKLVEETDVADTKTDIAAAVVPHQTATSDAPWDAKVQEEKLGETLHLTAAQQAFAWVNTADMSGDTFKLVQRSAGRFLHHEIEEDGEPGAANLTACSAGIGIILGARGGTDIPDTEKRAVYNHLAQHLRDAGQEPPPFSLVDSIEPLVAASHLISIPDVPPAEWFNEPTEKPEIGAITITDEGRIFGYLAPSQVAHRSFQDKRVTVPLKNVDYSRWMNRPTIVEGGDRLATGPLTMDCGHAAAVPWVSAQQSTDHYDNTCSVVATVRVGENRHGAWIAGALLPDVTPAQVARMLACQLSGDWRPHREKPGWRELTAALFVPVPGFPMATATQSIKMDHGELVASTTPVVWQACGALPESHEEPVDPDEDDLPDPASIAAGGKPNPGTDKDKRLHENKDKKKKSSAGDDLETFPQINPNDDGSCPDGYHKRGDMCEPDDSAAADTQTAGADDLPSLEELQAQKEVDAAAAKRREEIDAMTRELGLADD